MSIILVMEAVKKQFLEESNQLLHKIVRKKQDQLNNEKFKEKSSNDMMKCWVCDIKFRRYNRSTHEKTKRHQENVNNIYHQVIHTDEN
jgi:hypothetical protein